MELEEGNMMSYDVSVIGPRMGDPHIVVNALADLFRSPKNITEIYSPDRIIRSSISDYKGVTINLTGVIPVLLHKEEVYRQCLLSADVILYVLTASRALEHINREDFEVFSRLYFNNTLKKPVVVALNDFWCGNAKPGLFSPSEVERYIVSGAPIVQTKLGAQCCEGGFEVLDVLLEQVRIC